MGIEDAVNKGKDLYEQNKDKLAAAVKSELAEKIPPDAADKIDEIRESADKSIGNE